MSRPWSSLSARLWVRLGDPRVLCDHAVAARCLGPIHSRVGGGEELVRRGRSASPSDIGLMRDADRLVLHLAPFVTGAWINV